MDRGKALKLVCPFRKIIENAQGVVDASGFEEGLSEVTLKYWSALDQAERTTYLDMILRARSYLNVRGDLAENKRLADTRWYWHSVVKR